MNYIETWKMKKLVQRLRDSRGAGTSMISLVVPPGTQVCQINRLLTEEYGTATNIKSRVNRLSVLDAITSTQQKLKLYNRFPPNGLLLYCGTILTTDGKEKRVTIDIEPYKPINTSLYMCDNKFHVDVLKELLEDEEVFGFIIMTGDSCLYATLQGNARKVLHSFTVELPKKHRRGGQSSVRFARLRIEARQNYLKKVAEFSTQHFITDNKCNVKGIIIGGSADFKTELSKSDLFDPRLQKCIIQIVDLAYGGMSGFSQAINLSLEALGNIRLVEEKKFIQKFMTEVQIDTGKYCFTIEDTMIALELGAVETLIVWENLPTECNVIRDKKTGTETIHFKGNIPEGYEIVDQLLFVEWIANSFTKYGTALEFVTDCSTEGYQFVKGFSGVGGLLRWKVDFESLEEQKEIKIDEDSDENDFNEEFFEEDDFI